MLHLPPTRLPRRDPDPVKKGGFWKDSAPPLSGVRRPSDGSEPARENRLARARADTSSRRVMGASASIPCKRYPRRSRASKAGDPSGPPVPYEMTSGRQGPDKPGSPCTGENPKKKFPGCHRRGGPCKPGRRSNARKQSTGSRSGGRGVVPDEPERIPRQALEVTPLASPHQPSGRGAGRLGEVCNQQGGTLGCGRDIAGSAPTRQESPLSRGGAGQGTHPPGRSRRRAEELPDRPPNPPPSPPPSTTPLRIGITT